MKKILIFCECFSPGFKMGGIGQSMLNMVKSLSEDFEFYVFALNHEFNKPDEILNVPANEWTDFDKNIKVYYATDESLNYSLIKNAFQKVSPDIVYLNGLYEIRFLIYPIIIAKKKNIKIIQAPRGMLHEGALNLKPTKKKIFLFLFKLFNLQSNTTWHATDNHEIEDIKKIFGSQSQIVKAEDTPNISLGKSERIEKIRGELKLVFVSLIVPKKNILYTLELLSVLSSAINIKISYDIYGPVIDDGYWQTCKKSIEELPPNITVNYLGPVNPIFIKDLLKKYHFFILPTLGENFGHVIYESLQSGLPVIISDQTPWNYIDERRAGWVIPLKDKHRYLRVIEEAYEMENEVYQQLSENAIKVIEDFIKNSDFKKEYHNLFS